MDFAAVFLTCNTSASGTVSSQFLERFVRTLWSVSCTGRNIYGEAGKLKPIRSARRSKGFAPLGYRKSPVGSELFAAGDLRFQKQ